MKQHVKIVSLFYMRLWMAWWAYNATHQKQENEWEECRKRNTHPEFLCVCNVLISTTYYRKDAVGSSSSIATWCDVSSMLCNNWSWCSHRWCNRNFDHVWNHIHQHRCATAAIATASKVTANWCGTNRNEKKRKEKTRRNEKNITIGFGFHSFNWCDATKCGIIIIIIIIQWESPCIVCRERQ